MIFGHYSTYNITAYCDMYKDCMQYAQIIATYKHLLQQIKNECLHSTQVCHYFPCQLVRIWCSFIYVHLVNVLVWLSDVLR